MYMFKYTDEKISHIANPCVGVCIHTCGSVCIFSNVASPSAGRASDAKIRQIASRKVESMIFRIAPKNSCWKQLESPRPCHGEKGKKNSQSTYLYGSAFTQCNSGLPYYCIPPVCVPAVLGALDVWRQNTHTKKKCMRSCCNWSARMQHDNPKPEDHKWRHNIIKN